MLPIMSVSRRHKRKVFTIVGVLGSSYVLYKLYVAHKQKLFDLEREIEVERETEEAIKAQLQSDFENIQRIAYVSTLPYSMNNLRERLLEGLDQMQSKKRGS
ncbi:hypothetical protein GIB67_040933 [Kingdonia uniflora]|uniref:Uncharacterized protein n=1 Tax=Kingdonia uniflora TaxID=39325 RepID=A0A7J7PC58_9MAGN|nr:hypothetical protein GIB67_040933 [Kingdonia uniflora]